MDKLILLLITGLALLYISRYLYNSLKHHGDGKGGCHGCGSCGSCADCSSAHQSEVQDAVAINELPTLKPE